MSAPAVKVGDAAMQVERWTNGSPRLDRSWMVTIVRETPTTWIDNRDNRYRKSDGAKLPAASSGSRYLMTVDAFDAAKSVSP